jgi:hypothetical protein
VSRSARCTDAEALYSESFVTGKACQFIYRYYADVYQRL